MVAVTDATRPEVTAKLTVNGVEPKSTPLEGGGKNYTIYAGDDAVVTFTATDDSGKLKEMKVVARADLNDNALNGNFFGSSQYGTGDIVLSRAILRLPVRTLQPSQRLFI